MQTVDLDLEDPQFIRDPYPTLARWREAGPIVFHEGLGIHLACSYDAANTVLRSKSLGRIWVDREPDDLWHTFNWLHSDSILESEPPKHTRLRAIVARAFARGQIERLRPSVHRIAGDLLDRAQERLAATGSFDLIADYAEPLPVAVIAELLGVPQDRCDDLRSWSQRIVRMYDYRRTPQDELLAREAAEEFAEYMGQIAADRLREPGDDLLTHLAQVEAEGERLSERELVAAGVLLLNAGHEASVNGFGNGMVAMFDNPDQLERLVVEPSRPSGDMRALTETAIEEMVRFDTPAQLFERTAKEDTEILGVRLRAGDRIAALLGAANRDPAVFDEPDAFRIDRSPNPHIAFGVGIHFCLGAPLARMEFSVTLPLLLERFPTLRPAGDPILRDTFVLHGFTSVPVTA